MLGLAWTCWGLPGRAGGQGWACWCWLALGSFKLRVEGNDFDVRTKELQLDT